MKSSFPMEQNAKGPAAAIEQIKVVEKSFPGAIIIYNIQTSSVEYMSEWGISIIDTTLEQLKEMGKDYHEYFFNPEDAKDYVPRLTAMMERNNDDEFLTYFQQVRRSPEHEWGWYLSGSKVFFRDEDGKPLLTLTIALPVDTQHNVTAKAERLQEQNNFLRQNHHLFNKLTKREREILRLMALGHSSVEIAGQLFLSEKTANTHRRNIKRKLEIRSSYDITRFAQAFDLI